MIYKGYEIEIYKTDPPEGCAGSWWDFIVTYSLSGEHWFSSTRSGTKKEITAYIKATIDKRKSSVNVIDLEKMCVDGKTGAFTPKVIKYGEQSDK